jgi:hypothetical protein
MERFPDLVKLSWKFHKEEYSMGHGTYLISEATEYRAEDRTCCDGRKAPVLRFEIHIRKGNWGQREFYAFKGYPGTRPTAEPAPTTGDNGGIQVKLNQDKNGVELYFPDKPASEE